MNPTTAADYHGWKRDSEAIERDVAAGILRRDLPYCIYRDGLHVASFGDFSNACRYAQDQGFVGRCTIRDVFAPPPTIPMLIVKPEWQPIETAPTALSPFGLAEQILLASYGGREPTVCEGYFRHEVRDRDRIVRVKAGWVSCMDPNAPDPYLEPRFWQPMLDPPCLPEKHTEGANHE